MWAYLGREMDKVIEGIRMCNRILRLKLVLENRTVILTSTYALHVVVAEEQKDHFYDFILYIKVTALSVEGKRDQVCWWCYVNVLMICNTSFRKPTMLTWKNNFQ